MMKLNTYFVRLIYLILLQLINIKCNGLDQSGLCTVEKAGLVPNICDSSNYLVYVSEIESGCRTAGSKCWCILIDNRNLVYNGTMVIELVQISNRDNLDPEEIQYGEVKSLLTAKLISGINRILVQPYTPPEALTNITSITINDNEICILANSTNTTDEGIQSPSNKNNSLVTNDDESNQEYRILADCLYRNMYTENLTNFCPHNRPEFIIEKRHTLSNQVYWCININNDNFSLTSANHLNIVFSSPIRYFVSPSNAYIEREIPGSDFHLGNQKTIIAILEHNNQLTDLISVTIDNQTICSYFGPPIMNSSEAMPPKQYLIMPTATPIFQIPNVPDKSEVQKRQNKPIEESHSNLIGHPSTITEISQQQVQPILQVPDIPEVQKDYHQDELVDPNINKYPQSSVTIQSSTMQSCGRKPIYKTPFISFGLNTNPGDWPWHAAIYKLQSKTTSRNFICGGTLINRRTIVTAAHCVHEFGFIIIAERLTVELGRYDLLHASVATQEYRVYDVIPHESYNPAMYENDIAILILANYVQVTQYVNFICLPSPNVILQNKMGKTVGWGRDSNNRLQTELKEATLPVVTHITCLESNRVFFGRYLSNTNFCAGFMNNTNVCSGDSGGGLVFEHNNQWFLGGITSFGVSAQSLDRDCDIKQYVIFTDVTKFLAWIERNT